MKGSRFSEERIIGVLRVITPATLASLVNAISNFLASVVAKGAAALSEAEINRLQVEHGLAEAQFLGRFSELAT